MFIIGYPCAALSFANISVNSVPSVAKVFWLQLCRAVTSMAKGFRKFKNSSNPSILYVAVEVLNPGTPDPCALRVGLEKFPKMCQNSGEMDSGATDSNQEKRRPACFGDEAKYVAYMERATADAECAGCPSEDECGEFILLKCSRELIF